MALHDAEFNVAILKVLKKRDILGEANLALLIPLTYNIWTDVDRMEQKFQGERKSNPLLETTPAEAWICAQIMPFIQEVRQNADIDERILSRAIQEYFQRNASGHINADDADGLQLCTTIEPYLSAAKDLLDDICDRRKSLREIFGLRPGAYSIREAFSRRIPGSKREALILRGLREKWGNPRIARELDEKGVKPKNRNTNNKDYRSYRDMLRNNPQLFYSLKNGVKKKYESP
jgi:hypothetical protein